VCLILATLLLAGRSWSDTKRPEPPRPRTRIGLVNISHAIRSCDKYDISLKEIINEVAKPFNERGAKAKQQIEAWIEEEKQPATTKERRAAIQKERDALSRELTRLKRKLDKDLAEKQKKQLQVLYADVEAATQRYARAHGLDLVMQYNDAVTEPELHGTTNITRKVQAGACIPLYAVPGIDISKEIIAALNADLRKRKGG
jgi:Skp family chaperone for outer membrane proteins